MFLKYNNIINEVVPSNESVELMSAYLTSNNPKDPQSFCCCIKPVTLGHHWMSMNQISWCKFVDQMENMWHQLYMSSVNDEWIRIGIELSQNYLLDKLLEEPRVLHHLDKSRRWTCIVLHNFHQHCWTGQCQVSIPYLVAILIHQFHHSRLHPCEKR